MKIQEQYPIIRANGQKGKNKNLVSLNSRNYT